MLDFRTRVFAPRVPAAPGPRVSAGSSVLRGVGQQMAMQGLELQRPHPAAARGWAGMLWTCNRGCLEKRRFLPPAGTAGPPNSCGDCQPCLGEGVRARVSWCRHRRMHTLGLRFAHIGAQIRFPVSGPGSLLFWQDSARAQGGGVSPTPPSALGLPKTHLLRNLSKEREHPPFQGGARPVFKRLMFPLPLS